MNTAVASPIGVRATPPFRADHVGSFLRPKFLLDAREQFRTGAIDAARLRAVEDEAIRGIVKFQEDLGLRGITDGEYRRTYFHIDFLTQLEGVETKGGIHVKFHSAKGDVDFEPPVMHVTGKVRHTKAIQRADFEFLRSAATRSAATPIPTSRRSMPTSRPGMPTSCAASARPVARTSSSTTRTSRTSVMKQCAKARGNAATTRMNCRGDTRGSS